MKKRIPTEKIKTKVSVPGKKNAANKFIYPRKKETLFVIDPKKFEGIAITAMNDGKHCNWYGHTIRQIRKKENNPHLRAVPWNVVEKHLEKYHKSLCKPFEEITEEKYWYWLECVPPKRFKRNSFFVGECYTGTLYQFCFQLGDKYFTALRSIRLSDAELNKEINEFAETLS